MTMKVGGRHINADHLRYGVMADNAELGHVSRGQLIGLARQLPMLGLVNGTEVHLLTVLLNTAPAASFDKGGKPIVFKSNKQLAFEIGRSEGRVSRILSRLYACGLIVMRDSGNFKRYPVHNSKDGIKTACGIDLRVFIARYHELQQCVAEARERNREKASALRRFRGLYRQIQACIENIEVTAFVSMLLRRVQRIVEIVREKRDNIVHKLKKSIHLLEWILCRLHAVSMSKMTCLYVENDIHIHNTNPKLSCNCNENRSLVNTRQNNTTDVTIGHENMAYENSEPKTNAPSSIDDSALGEIQSQLLVNALPTVKMYLKGNLQSINDIINNLSLFSKVMGISTDALTQAKSVMGLKKTALAIGIILEKYNREMITSPGGYLRGMIEREKKGKLYLNRSLYSLLKLSIHNRD